MAGSIVAGGQVCVAVDLVNKRIWMRLNANAWFNDVAANPATNTNGLDISSLFTSNAAFPLVTCNSTTPHLTANFGATAFAQAMPSGFISWKDGASIYPGGYFQLGNIVQNWGTIVATTGGVTGTFAKPYTNLVPAVTLSGATGATGGQPYISALSLTGVQVTTQSGTTTVYYQAVGS